ncbi:hypothetical protein PpBr36_04312 [Pyricularia pennisetigena]|uniref:hypothetical protein n=1 Tax=Pyricularia pennisetigena TaxID=1578925 RepID=UPI001151F164|nr:hypothetical protein PpBr36_04312 [Pyricularia pennisetigena]TLS27687.1 hypothetical protein PpBr36_04312 [Pyricularia pennisetigena]
MAPTAPMNIISYPSAPGSDNGAPPPWQQQQFQGAPTPEQVKALQEEEKRRAEIKARAGQPNAGVGEVVKTISADDFLKVHQAPCSRDGFLQGIAAGAAVGGLRYVIGAPIPKSANWAVGAFVLAATGSYEYCQYNRRLQRENMKRTVEVYTQRAAEAKAKQEAKKKAEEEAEAARLAAQKSWYKFW